MQSPGDPGRYPGAAALSVKSGLHRRELPRSSDRSSAFAQFDKTKARAPFFLKPPVTTVVGSGKVDARAEGRHPIRLGDRADRAVIGTRARHVSAGRCAEHVAGYTVGIDLSARDLLLHPQQRLEDGRVRRQGVRRIAALSARASCRHALSEIRRDLQMKLSVNGAVKQNASTSLMIWTVAEQIAEISSVTTLEPGDVILTGTPAGAAYPHGPFLKAGDRIDAEIEKIGALHVEILP